MNNYLLELIDKYLDKLSTHKANKILKNLCDEDLIDWEEAIERAGWNLKENQ